MIQIHTTKNKQIIRASLEENTQRALTVSQDVKIPDEPITIDKDLLQRIYDQLAFIAWDKADSGCEDLQKELDSLYPFLMNISTTNPPVRLNPEEAIKLMDSLDETKKCQFCGCETHGLSPCPFVEEIHNEESMCNCCDECRHECAQNI